MYIYKLLEKFVRFWTLLGFLLLTAISILSLYNSISYFSKIDFFFLILKNFNIYGYEDLVRLLISCSALMFLPFCHIKKGHINITFLSFFLNSKIIYFLNRFTNILFFIIYFFLFYWMIFGLVEVYADNVVSSVINIQEWPFYIPGIVSLFICSLLSLFNIFGME